MKNPYGKMLGLIALLLLLFNACSPADFAQALEDAEQQTVEDASTAGSTVLSLSVEDTSADDASEAEAEPGEDFHLSGMVEAITGSSITVDGQTYTIDENTVLDLELAVGAFAQFEYITLDDGTLLLIEIEVESESGDDASEDEDSSSDDSNEDEGSDEAGEDEHLSGVIEEITDTTITIDGQVYTIDENTELDDGLVVGAFARLEFTTLSDGSLLLKEIEVDGDSSADSSDKEDESGDDVDEQEDESDDKDDDSSGSGSDHEDDHEDDDNSGSDHEDEHDDGDD